MKTSLYQEDWSSFMTFKRYACYFDFDCVQHILICSSIFIYLINAITTLHYQETEPVLQREGRGNGTITGRAVQQQQKLGVEQRWSALRHCQVLRLLHAAAHLVVLPIFFYYVPLYHASVSHTPIIASHKVQF